VHKIPECMPAMKNPKSFKNTMLSKSSKMILLEGQCLQCICTTALYMIVNYAFEEKYELLIERHDSLEKKALAEGKNFPMADVLGVLEKKVFEDFPEESEVVLVDRKRILEMKLG
jgi:hypothetical protein